MDRIFFPLMWHCETYICDVGVAVFGLNRPDVKNAISRQLISDVSGNAARCEYCILLILSTGSAYEYILMIYNYFRHVGNKLATLRIIFMTGPPGRPAID